jgi:hypothetical protein
VIVQLLRGISWIVQPAVYVSIAVVAPVALQIFNSSLLVGLKPAISGLYRPNSRLVSRDQRVSRPPTRESSQLGSRVRLLAHERWDSSPRPSQIP